MASNLARILKTDMPRLPLRKAAEQLRKKGRGKDTMLAHITPKEAALLKARGGSGTINPDTGLPEFDDSFFSSFDFNLPTEISTPIESGNFYTSNVQLPDFVQQPAFGSGVDQASVDQTRQSYGQGPFGDLTQNLGTGTSAPGYDPNLAQSLQNYIQANYPAGTDPTVADVNRFVASTTTPTTQPVVPEYKLTPEQQAEVQSDLEGQPIDLTTKVPSTGGVQTPFGTLGTKELIAALGLGGLGLSYMNAQNQGKSAAAQLQAAYQQAADQTKSLAQPYMQQGGQALATTLQGALTPASQQAYQQAQARAAQAVASSGGVGALQAGTALGNTYQNLLSAQQQMATSLLGAGTPLISQAIQQQLSGTTTGINAQMQLSQQAGQAAAGMLGMLGKMFG